MTDILHSRNHNRVIAMGKIVVQANDNTSVQTPLEPALARLREDMELIGYVASHDLMAPLRIIDHCCSILKENPQPNGEAQEALQMLDVENARAKILLQGLLEYIRLEIFSFSHVKLDSNELAAAAIETLAEEIRAAGATVTCDSLPEIIGHRARLVRLFAQLIDNAVKFHGEQPPKVHISARRSGNDWTFCIEDNGIGIDPELHEAAFRLFQRLHNADAYPGYGIGLALSQKIVSTHGGRLWVESESGQGSRFFFTLPAADAKSLM
jgi:light-regulated signal transduction histidine kinase (bacteriophytochrome)